MKRKLLSVLLCICVLSTFTVPALAAGYAEVVSPKYDIVSRFSEGMAAVQLNGKWGFIDKTGKEVVPFKYDDAFDFHEGMAKIKLNGKIGFIDMA